MPKASVLGVRQISLLLGLLILFLVLAGATYQMVGTWYDAWRFPQHGRPIQVGQIKLNLDCAGDRSPGAAMVVLDSGSGVPALGWILVQPEVAKFARVCSYDRAGYGWSDPGPEPRTTGKIARELKALLNTAGERGPT